MDTQEVLAAALEELELNGWCKHECENKIGEHCALGAIMATNDILHNPTQATFEAAVHVYNTAVHALYQAIPDEITTQINTKYQCRTLKSNAVALERIAIACYNNDHCNSLDDIFDWFIRAKEYA